MLHKENVILLGLTADFPCYQSFKFPIALSLTPVSSSQMEEATEWPHSFQKGVLEDFFPPKYWDNFLPLGEEKSKSVNYAYVGNFQLEDLRIILS